MALPTHISLVIAKLPEDAHMREAAVGTVYAVYDHARHAGWVARGAAPREWLAWNLEGRFWVSCEKTREEAAQKLWGLPWSAFMRR